MFNAGTARESYFTVEIFDLHVNSDSPTGGRSVVLVFARED
jgi:hypothetical protein